MSVKTKSENFLNYITGSAGGWPANTNIGILGNIDYLVETGSNDIYFLEFNTNVGIIGSISDQTSIYNSISDYANEQSCNTCYVYGVNDSGKQNPTTYQQTLISSSFARHDITTNFEYNNNTSHTYFSQRENTDHLDKFHLFIQTPWYSDDNLKSIVSGSFNKTTFRSLLSSSTESESLIPLFDSSSPTTNTNNPDFIIKNPSVDGGFINNYKMYDWNGSNTRVTDAIATASSEGHIVEKFIVMSGSSQNSETGRFVYLTTPTKQIELKDYVVPLLSHKSDGNDGYKVKSYGRTTASGSLIGMFDGSTKQVQDVEVGDVVLSYQPYGMPDETKDYLSYTTTDLSGSTTQGSIVVEAMNTKNYGYYLINDSIKAPYNLQQASSDVRYFVKQGDTWEWITTDVISTGDYLLDPSGNEVEVVSKTEHDGDELWYSLDVEDIDTYFQSNILVHNIPPKCFVAGTPITMGDGTTKVIERVEIGDEVMNYNFKDEEVQTGKVTTIDMPIHADIIEISFNSKTTKNTFDHPYWVVGKGWSSYKPEWTKKRYDIESNQLEVGDKCLELRDGKLVEREITNIVEDINPVQTYSLEITTNHNYFANDVLVHNKFCLMEDQVINMGDGVYKRIDEVELGESILQYDEETEEFKEGKVNVIRKKLHDNCYGIKVESGQTIKATDNHPFLLRDKGWSTIGENNPTFLQDGGGIIKVGDYVRDIDGWVEIVEINKIEGEYTTYNLLEQDYGTIIAHDIVTHNSP